MDRPPSSVLHSQIAQVGREDYLYFLLGLVSFSRALLAALERERALGGAAPPPEEPVGAGPSPLLT